MRGVDPRYVGPLRAGYVWWSNFQHSADTYDDVVAKTVERLDVPSVDVHVEWSPNEHIRGWCVYVKASHAEKVRGFFDQLYADLDELNLLFGRRSSLKGL